MKCLDKFIYTINSSNFVVCLALNAYLAHTFSLTTFSHAWYAYPDVNARQDLSVKAWFNYEA